MRGTVLQLLNRVGSVVRRHREARWARCQTSELLKGDGREAVQAVKIEEPAAKSYFYGD